MAANEHLRSAEAYYWVSPTARRRGIGITWRSLSLLVLHDGKAPEDQASRLRAAAALQLPFFHIGGPNIFMLPLVHVGGRTVLCAGFDVEQTFDLIDAGAVTAPSVCAASSSERSNRRVVFATTSTS